MGSFAPWTLLAFLNSPLSEEAWPFLHPDYHHVHPTLSGQTCSRKRLSASPLLPPQQADLWQGPHTSGPHTSSHFRCILFPGGPGEYYHSIAITMMMMPTKTAVLYQMLAICHPLY